MLATLYAALYGLLVSEDNALVLGSLLLFAILAVAMLATRRIDWYAAPVAHLPAGVGA
jgi:inner membrane protein